MYPQLFLETFWGSELRPQIFVAMSFADAYEARFNDVIAPAIRETTVDGVNLEPYRVDISKSGDSILTDIMDGIAHSHMVLADVSTVGHDSKSGKPYRNANVMYEVGLALACRQSAEVLLVRDDQDDFLFDVSTIPHLHVDFADTESARGRLREEMMARLKERDLINDARIRLAIFGLSNEEVQALKMYANSPPRTVWGPASKDVSLFWSACIPRLLDKQLIQLVGEFNGGSAAYAFTPLGRITARLVDSRLPEYKADVPVDEGQQENQQRSREDT